MVGVVREWGRLQERRRVGAPQWNQPLEDPREACPRQMERQAWRALHTRPARCRCTCGKGPEREARTSRHVRVRKLPVGGLLVLNFNYTSKHW